MPIIVERADANPSRPSGGALAFLASRRWRIFLIAWIVYSVHFATNIVREHYPAFSLAEHGAFRVDEYQGFHPDIFVYTDGHSYINNQVFTSALAAIPLFIFDPLLDALEHYSKQRLVRQGVGNTEYRTDKPLRVAFYRLVKERGLELRFGAASAITSAFFMAPLSALMLELLYGVLRRRGIRPREATQLTLLFGFGTPLFFRTSHLNHNLVVMYAMFASFALLWRPAGERVSLRNRLLAGVMGGITVATDYIGAVILPLLYGYLLVDRARTASWWQSFRESLAFVLGTVPPVLFLLGSQWAMFGNPFLPAQHWMPLQNEYVGMGMRGMGWPAPDLMLFNLVHPGYGLFLWGPLFILSFIPVRRLAGSERVLPWRDYWFVMACFVGVLLFSSANQFGRLQWNSGFRYLVPLLPFLFLALVDRWRRLPPAARATIAATVVLHSWVLTVFREPVQISWRLFLSEGIQLPWSRVVRMTTAHPGSLLGSWLLPAALLLGTGLVCWGIWRYGARMEAAGSR